MCPTLETQVPAMEMSTDAFGTCVKVDKAGKHLPWVFEDFIMVRNQKKGVSSDRAWRENSRPKVLEGGLLIGLKGCGWHTLNRRNRGDIRVCRWQEGVKDCCLRNACRGPKSGYYLLYTKQPRTSLRMLVSLMPCGTLNFFPATPLFGKRLSFTEWLSVVATSL